MRVLVIAPSLNLDVRPEIRQIQRKHHVSTLDGPVTAEDIYNTCRDTAFDIIHFASHSSDKGVLLSNGAILTPEKIAQLAKMHDTGCVVFNSCLSGKPASYLVRHGVRYAIYSNIELLDTESWELMVGFYDSLGNGAHGDVLLAYDRSAADDGDYGISIDVRYVLGLQSSVTIFSSPAQRPITRRELLLYSFVILAACGLLTAFIIFVAGKI